jgi:hypothetical protein
MEIVVFGELKGAGRLLGRHTGCKGDQGFSKRSFRASDGLRIISLMHEVQIFERPNLEYLGRQLETDTIAS